MNIRAYEPRDLPALYRICFLTGDAGQDATGFYRDPLLLGHVFAAPYAVLVPQSCLVVEDAEGVGGYIVGARDTEVFEAALEQEWWPALRKAYPFPVRERQDEPRYDRFMLRFLHAPPRTPAHVTDAYPSHLHINLLPRLQQQGLGKLLISAWLERMREQGSTGAHLAVGERNARAVAFYKAYGFRELGRVSRRDGDIVWFGMSLMK